jgi:predicted ATPase
VFLYGNDTGIGCRLTQIQTLWYFGYPDQAKQGADETLALAWELGHPFTLVYALQFAAMVHQLCRKVQTVRGLTKSAIQVSQEHSFALFAALTTALHGWAQAMEGLKFADAERVSAGIEQMKAGIATLRAEGAVSMLPHLLASLAEVYGQASQIQEALGLVDEAQDLAKRAGGHFGEAELHRLKGELLLAQGAGTTQAGNCFQRALDVACRQHARSWELRAATSLARLWQRQERTEEARALLQGVYGWFTEGFETADLQEARALLDTLT